MLKSPVVGTIFTTPTTLYLMPGMCFSRLKRNILVYLH